MGKYFNQRGYALLIVLLTIIIFLSLSAVFISGFLNHVTQEKTVDMNNQAVVAAEMGVKFISSNINNEIHKEIDLLKDGIKEKRNKILACEAQKKCNNKDVLQKEFNDSQQSAGINFQDFVNGELESYINDLINKKYFLDENDAIYYKLVSPTGSELIEYDIPIPTETNFELKLFIKGFNENDVSQTMQFNIVFDKINKIILNDDKFIIESFEVTDFHPIVPVSSGEKCLNLNFSNVSGKKVPLDCEIEFDKLNAFKSHITSLNLEPSDFNVFIQNPETLEVKGSLKDLYGFNIFVDNNFKLPNINNLRNFKLFVNGKLEVDNANNLNAKSDENSYIISRELTSDKFNGTGINNTTFVLLGFDEKEKMGTASLNVTGKFRLNTNSKICINLDRFTLASKTLLNTVEYGGEIIYYSSEKYNFTNKNAEYYHTKNFNSFLNKCGLNNLSDNNPILVDVINVDYQ